MSYVNPDFKSKKELKEAVARYNAYTQFVQELEAAGKTPDEVKQQVKEVYGRTPQPLYSYNPSGMFEPPKNGTDTIEGPHYPKPHRWYARVKVENGIVVKVLG